MKRKSKGKIHPSPTPSSSSPAPPPTATGEAGDVLSVLNVLPSAILALVLVLSLEDREVLAYMITRSIEVSTATATATATTPASAVNTPTGKKKALKKLGGGGAHRPPLFHCDCFDCYTAYWLRWDSSASRELIHQAIEAFEEHLDHAERPVRGGKPRREKSVHPGCIPNRPETPVEGIPQFSEGEDRAPQPKRTEQEVEEDEDLVLVELSEEIRAEQVAAELEKEKSVDAEAMAAAWRGMDEHKGLVRKLLPDVVGMLNSRLWRLWNPSV